MTTAKKHQSVLIAEYEANDLGVPFKVILLNSVRQLIDGKTGEVDQVIIPNLRGLIKCIAITRILNSRKLSGGEIRFVRKAFKLPSKHVAEMIGVTPEHLSRCESEERLLSAGAEKCLRVSIFLEQFKIFEELDALCEKDSNLERKLSDVREAIKKIGNIIREMKISAAFEASPLVFKFHINSDPEKDLFNDDLNVDWSSNDKDLAMAA